MWWGNPTQPRSSEQLNDTESCVFLFPQILEAGHIRSDCTFSNSVRITITARSECGDSKVVVVRFRRPQVSLAHLSRGFDGVREARGESDQRTGVSLDDFTKFVASRRLGIRQQMVV